MRIPHGRAILTSAVLVLALAGALAPALTSAGGERIDAMFTRAAATFAVARALNGAISVVQGTEVALQPAGVGVTLTVGQALDPLNDLVERFSWIMLAATAALGAQSVLLEATAATPLAIALVIVGLATLVRIWWPALTRLDHHGLLPRVLLILLFVRLAIPLSALGANAFSDAWLAPRRTEAIIALEQTREELVEVEEATRAPASEDDASVLEALRRFLGETSTRLDPSARLASLADRLETAAGRLVDLIVVFVLETIVVPLGSLWLLWRLTALLQTPWRQREEQR